MPEEKEVIAETPASETIELNPELDAPVVTEKTEEEKKAEHLANLNKAIEEAQEELRKTREEKKTEKTETTVPTEFETAKKEVRQFALAKFLEGKPALASSPEKMKSLMEYYERIRTATETTQEGVLMDLDKAYAVVYHQDILKHAHDSRIAEATKAQEFSMPAIDGGSTAYQTPTPKDAKTLTTEESQILASWGMTPAQWQEMQKKHSSQ